ncbi:MAG: hypothetical protein IJW40_09635 [Clostridia bacterium]|nr:hypothetical protein [Clostridia bacterium]
MNMIFRASRRTLRLILTATALMLAAAALTACAPVVPDDPEDTGFPFELPQYEEEQSEPPPEEETPQEEETVEKQPLGPSIKIPAHEQAHPVDLSMVLESPAKARCYRSVAFDLQGTVLVCTFYKECILLEVVYRFAEYGDGYVLQEYFFCPYEERYSKEMVYYGYYRERNNGDEDFSEYEHKWTYDNYEEVIQVLLQDMSGEIPSLARQCGVDARAVYQRSVDLLIEYGPYFRDEMRVDIYEMEHPDYGKLLYLANPDTHLLERVIFLEEEMHGAYPGGWEDMTAEEQSYFTEEVRDILPADWHEWTDWELYRASTIVASARFNYGPGLGSVLITNAQEKTEEWDYRLKVLRRLPRN